MADERVRTRTEILETNPNIDDVNLVVKLVTEEGTVNSIPFHSVARRKYCLLHFNDIYNVLILPH